ncbi:MAG: hypothetical protein JNL93_20325 [Pelomonas sp.]|nr:hypothetical protein [Roseateles sp.]
MPFFNVLVEGSNLFIPGKDGDPPVVGFFASRVVWASKARKAEQKALQSVRDEWQTGEYANHPTSDRLQLAASEVSRSSFSRWLGAPNKGHVFFPSDAEDDVFSAKRTA